MALKCFVGKYSFPKPKDTEPSDSAKEAAGHILKSVFGASNREVREVYVVAADWPIAAEQFEAGTKEGERLECIHLVGDAI